MQITELIDLFNKIKHKNPSIALSGSLALFLQNVRLPRLPQDIDISIPFGQEFNEIDGMIPREVDGYPDHTIEDNIHRWGYYFKGNKLQIKVDIFQPTEDEFPNDSIIFTNNIECTHKRDIIKHKLYHALNGNEKHKSDILYIVNSPDHAFPNIKIERPIIFFDTETTGTDKTKDRIVELSTIKYFPDYSFEIKTLRFNPIIPIPQAASEVHGIYQRDIENQPTFAQIASQLAAYFSDCDLAGFNIINFDLPLLVEEFSRANIEVPFLKDKKVIDSLKIFHKNEKRDLASAYKFYCGKDITNAHSADADTIATIEVLHEQIKKYKLSTSLMDLHTLCNDQLETIDYEGKFVRNTEGKIVFNFGQHKGESVTHHIDYLEWMLEQNFASYTKVVIQKILRAELR